MEDGVRVVGLGSVGKSRRQSWHPPHQELAPPLNGTGGREADDRGVKPWSSGCNTNPTKGKQGTPFSDSSTAGNEGRLLIAALTKF